LIRYLFGSFALACGCLAAFAAERPATRSDSKPAPMRFEWRSEVAREQCSGDCRIWVTAVGAITEDTAREFEQFAKRDDVRGATLVLDSEGGSVHGALALGRAIRRFEMTTTVGKVEAPSAREDAGARAMLSPKANCESMCAFVLLGGVRRYVPPEAQVLVHQIWLGSKSKRALESTYSAEELDLVQRDIGRLARYTVEMDGGIELLETALRVPPWQPMHVLSDSELRRMRLSTIERLFETAVPKAAASPSSTGALTAVSPSPAGALATAQAQRND
jgi:hypothetical protein